MRKRILEGEKYGTDKYTYGQQRQFDEAVLALFEKIPKDDVSGSLLRSPYLSL